MLFANSKRAHFSETFLKWKRVSDVAPVSSQQRRASSSLYGGLGLGPHLSLVWSSSDLRPLSLGGSLREDPLVKDSVVLKLLWTHSIHTCECWPSVPHSQSSNIYDVWRGVAGCHSNGFDEIGTWFPCPVRWKVNGMLSNTFSLQQSSLYNQPSIKDQACVSGTGSKPLVELTNGSALDYLPFCFPPKGLCFYITQLFQQLILFLTSNAWSQWSENNNSSSILPLLLTQQMSSETWRLRDEKSIFHHPMVQ